MSKQSARRRSGRKSEKGVYAHRALPRGATHSVEDALTTRQTGETSSRRSRRSARARTAPRSRGSRARCARAFRLSKNSRTLVLFARVDSRRNDANGRPGSRLPQGDVAADPPGEGERRSPRASDGSTRRVGTPGDGRVALRGSHFAHGRFLAEISLSRAGCQAAFENRTMPKVRPRDARASGSLRARARLSTRNLSARDPNRRFPRVLSALERVPRARVAPARNPPVGSRTTCHPSSHHPHSHPPESAARARPHRLRARPHRPSPTRRERSTTAPR